MKRRLPRGLRESYAQRAVEYGYTRKTAKELMHVWVSSEKRRTHKRERREGKIQIRKEAEGR